MSNNNVINNTCTRPLVHSFSAEHKKRYFKKLAYLGVEKAKRLGYRLRWFVLTESDASIEAGINFGHEWKNMQDWTRRHFGEEMQFIWVEHLQGDKMRYNRHIIQYGINRLDVDELEGYWQSHFLSKLTGLEEIRNPGKAIKYVAGYLVKGEGDEKFVRSRHSQGWLFRGAHDFSMWHKKFFGYYPYDEHLIHLSLMSSSNSEYISKSLKPQLIEDNTVKFNKIIFESDNYFIIQTLVLHNKTDTPEVIAIGKIAGIDEVETINQYDESAKKGFLQSTFEGNGIVQVVRILSYFLAGVLIIVIGVLIGLGVGNLIKRARRKKVTKLKKVISLPQGKNEKKLIDKLFDVYIQEGKSVLNSVNRMLKDETYIKRKRGHFILEEGDTIDYTAVSFLDDMYRGIMGVNKYLDDIHAITEENGKTIIVPRYRKAMEDFLRYMK